MIRFLIVCMQMFLSCYNNKNIINQCAAQQLIDILCRELTKIVNSRRVQTISLKNEIEILCAPKSIDQFGIESHKQPNRWLLTSHYLTTVCSWKVFQKLWITKAGRTGAFGGRRSGDGPQWARLSCYDMMYWVKTIQTFLFSECNALHTAHCNQ